MSAAAKPRAMILDMGRPTDAPVDPVPTQAPPADPRPAGGEPDPAASRPPAAGPGATTTPADTDTPEDEEPGPVTYADDYAMQAARLAVRSFARHRDALAAKAAAARSAVEGLRSRGGNPEQVAMVLADGRVQPRELGFTRAELR